jgi:NhaP-type Na+/H+ or K+/H+ antiporter
MDFRKEAKYFSLRLLLFFLTIVVQGLTLPLLIRLLRIKRETATQRKARQNAGHHPC